MKFIELIEHNLQVLNEEPIGTPAPAGTTDPVAAAGPPPPEEAPAEETPGSALPDEEEDKGEDDASKVKLDLVELVRKALIMAPKHIDDVDFAKLTEIVDHDNIERMEELVSRIVRNNYPHPDM